MFAIPGIVGLIFFTYLRPQEYFVALQRVPLLYLFFGLAVLGYLVDLRLRLVKPSGVAQLPFAVLFFVWGVLSIVIKAPADAAIPLLIALVMQVVNFFVIAHSVQSLRAFRIVAGTLLFIGVFLAVVGVHQRQQPLTCVLADETTPGDGWPDGRPCQQRVDCRLTGEPGADYYCEHVGLLDTFSMNQRVRYRGELSDPNELALAVCAVVPLLFAMGARKKRFRWKVLAAVGAVLIFFVVIYSQSRGGQLVYVAVLGVYVINRLKWKGVALGVLLAIPVMMMGGRSDDPGADISTEHRYMAWRGGLGMVKSNPVTGVGMRQFGQHFFMTAHNSYILTPAELGLPGMFLWVALLYMSIKIPVSGMLRYRNNSDAEAARVWGLALLAAWAGFLIQLQFLSLAYHSMLWIYFGLSGAYYSTVRSHDPEFRVRFGVGDAALCAAGMAVYLLILLPGFLKFKGF